MIDIKRQEEAFEKLNGAQQTNPVNLKNIIYLSKEKFNPANSAEIFKCIELENIESNTGRIIGEYSSLGAKSIKNVFDKDSILYGKLRPYLNKYSLPKFSGVCSSEILVFKPKGDYPKEYPYYILQSRGFNKVVENTSGTKMPRLSSVDILNHEFLLHKKIHIENIANFLTSLDELIQKQEEYIEELKVQKQGIIKHLMFDESNREFKLSELGKFKKGSGLSKEDVTDFGVNKCILYGELFTKYSEEIRKVYSMTDKEGNYISNGKEVLIPGSTTTGAREIAIARSLCEKDIIIGSDTIVFECNERVDNRYLAYYLTHIGWEEIAQKAVGITIIHLYGKDIANNKVLLPDKLKQKNISNLLSLLEDKINLNGKKLEQLKLKKKYYLNTIFS